MSMLVIMANVYFVTPFVIGTNTEVVVSILPGVSIPSLFVCLSVVETLSSQ